VNAASPPVGVTASVTVNASGSEATAVTSASAARPKSALEIVAVRDAPRRIFRDETLELSRGSVTVTLTTKSVRPAALKVRTAASVVAELLKRLKVAVPLTGLTVCSTEMSAFVDRTLTASVDSSVVSDVIATALDLPVRSASELPTLLAVTSDEMRAVDVSALAGVARPAIPMRATNDVAIARTKTVERLADTITDLFSMRADYGNKVSLSLNLAKE
jgi:hypothetical protein